MSRSDLITSADNAKLKLVRRLQRRRDETLFVAEGEDLVYAGGAPQFVLVAAGSGLEGLEVEADLLADVSALGSGTRAIAVFERPPSGRAWSRRTALSLSLWVLVLVFGGGA